MDKAKTSKKSAPSLRAKKKSTDRQKPSPRPGSQNSRNSPSSKQSLALSQKSKRSNVGGGTPKNGAVSADSREPVTDKDKNKKKEEEKKKEVKKKPAEAEKKLDRTQDDPPKEEQKKIASEAISTVEVIPDKNPAKMDDGYEDFGPGAA